MPTEDRNWDEDEQFESDRDITWERECLDDPKKGPTPEAGSPILVVSDAEAEGEPLPSVFTKVGDVTHWNNSPSFTEITVRLESDSEVRPGQFLGVWHGSRGRRILTVRLCYAIAF